MQYLLAHDDGSFAQVEELEDEIVAAHDTGELTIIALQDGKFCSAAIDKKEDGSYEIVAWNPL